MSDKILESAQRARTVRGLSSVATQVEQKVRDGYTVFISTATHKVRYGRETLEFEGLYDMDESDLRPQLVGGIFATNDPDVIRRIESLVPRIFTQRFDPDTSKRAAKDAVKAFSASVEKRGGEADQVTFEASEEPGASVPSDADKASLLAVAGKKGS